MTTVLTSTPGSKPAPHLARTACGSTSEAVSVVPMVVSAKKIANLAAELAKLLNDFGDRFDAGSIIRSLGRAGIEPSNPEQLREVASQLLKDCTGAAWVLEVLARQTSEALEGADALPRRSR